MSIPTIGIFAFRDSPIDTLAPERTRALLAEAALQEVDLCFFASADCDPVSGRVEARRWRRGVWEKATIGLPCVVVITTNPVAPEHRVVKDWLYSRSRIATFRERNKLEATALVEASPWAEHAIPSAGIDPGAVSAQLAAWLAGGGIVVKPSDGMRGHGVHFVVPDGDAWTAVYGGGRWRDSSSEVVSRVERAIRGRMRYRDYLVQRYIESVNEAGQPISIRVDVARLPGGGWGLIRIVGRIAANRWMVSNGATGGGMVRIAPFLAARRVRPAEALAREAVALAIGVADAVSGDPSRATNYECGVDLAIDADDKLWFIEANPRPQAVWAEHERAVLVMAYLKSLAAA